LALAVVLVCLLVAYLALYPALVGFVAGATRRLPRPLWALLFVPGAWLLSELLRGWVMTGFPWLALGYSTIDAPVMDLVPLGGVYFMSALVVAAAGVLVLLFLGSISARLISVLLIAVTPVMLWLVPPATSWTEATGTQLDVAIIQGNFGQDVKWDQDYLGPTLARYRRLTEATDADLVIWPEVAIPALARHVQDYLHSIDYLASNKNQTVLIGTLTRDANGTGYYNTILALGESHGEYHKHHLVPFGEYFPLPDFAKRWLDVLEVRYSTLARGSLQQEPIRIGSTSLGASICFEDVFGEEVMQALPQAGLLVNVTNDAWFTGTIAAAQHFEISRMRALEAGRVLLRAANTGISGIVAASGRAIRKTHENEVAVIEAVVQTRTGATPYVRFGNWPLWAAGVFLTALGLGWAGLQRRRGASV
ncbi:MAG TPA: apolipoprotein N-acyltransferase, partial [Salinisphaeraceae bacterium]|nr:apolipoprotein N-acyltransferase [Salinisphaeraceae bacterium]